MAGTWYSKTQADTLLGGKVASNDARLTDARTPLPHTASLVTDFDTAVGSKVDTAMINNAFGQRAGVAIRPWEKSAPAGDELWKVAKFLDPGGAPYNTTTLTPSLPANGTPATLITRVKYLDVVGGNEAFRLEFDYTLPSSGWAGISLRCLDGGAVTIGQEQWLVTASGPGPRTGRFLFDFAPAVLNGALIFEVKLRMENNATGSNLAISNVTLRQVSSDATRPMLVSKMYSTGNYPLLYLQQRDVKTNVWKMAELSFQADADNGDLQPVSQTEITGYYNDKPFLTPYPDPAMKQTANAVNDEPGIQRIFNAPSVSLRWVNNDQIHTVWNGTAYEYRGNVHQGEFTRAAGVSYKIDKGAGLVPWTLDHLLTAARRFQVILPTEYRRSTDGTTPYCNVDRTITTFPDGMQRTDRTTTFTQNAQMWYVFEWMSSHYNDVPYIGRLGRGLTVLGETDSFPHAATPATPTTATATTGGTLAAATYSYRVASVAAAGGESVPSTAVTQATTGSASTVTLTWTAAAGAVGYKVYGRTAGFERLIGSTTGLTFTDTGAAVPTDAPAQVNTSRIYNGTSNDTMAQSADATWAVYREPRTGWCYGNIYDRDAALSRTGVTAIHTRLMRGNGIQKNYANLVFANADYVVTSGTVWSATHWSYVYLPADPVNYHNEVAVRAASLSALKSIYPAT